MKTYNTIEDILNDHELMNLDGEDLWCRISEISLSLLQEIETVHAYEHWFLQAIKASTWLKSEYKKKAKTRQLLNLKL